MNLFKRFSSSGGLQAGIAFAGRASQQITGLAVTVLAASFLAPGDYGVFMLATAFAMLLQSLSYSGVFHFIAREDDQQDGFFSTCFWVMVLVALAGSALLAAAAPLLGYAFGAPEFATILLWLLLDQVIGIPIAWISAVLIRREELTKLYSINIVSNLVSFALGVGAIYLWNSVYALVVYRFICTITGLLLFSWFTQLLPGWKFNRKTAAEAFRYSTGIYGSRGLTFFSQYGADLILGFAFSTHEVGLFRFANRIVTAAVEGVCQPLANFSVMQFSADHRRNASLSTTYLRFLSSTFLMVGIVCISIAILIEPSVSTFFGQQYQGAIWVAYALCIGRFLQTPDSFVVPSLAATGKTNTVFWFTSAKLAISTILLFSTAPFGLYAVTNGQAVAMALTGLAAAILIARNLHTDTRQMLLVLGRTAVLLTGFALVSWLTVQGVLQWGGTTRLIAFLACCCVGAYALASIFVGVKQNVLSMKIFAKSQNA